MGERGGVTKKKSSKSMNQVEPSKSKSAKAWEQSKGDSGDLNHNYYRWLQSALNSAVGEHRWEDAFKLLPCLILHRCYNVSSDFLWRMMNIITKSAKEVPEGMRKSMSRDFLLLPTKTIVVVLDTLAEELETATDERIDEILQMLEDYKNDRRSEKWSVKNKDVRLTALIDAYRGLVLYSRWKNHTYSNQDSSAVQEKITGLLENMSDEENEDGGKDSNRGLVNKAHSALRRALCNLAEPVEWIIVPYLDLENELRGPESALAVLQDYVSKNLQHLPAQHLVYNFLRTFVPNSDETQMSALKEITRVCPEHPLTLEYVDRLMAEACDEEVWKRTETAVDSDETESKVSMNQSNDSETETQSCGLKSDIQVESLVRALNLLTNLLEYKEWQWKLQPWQTLTHILRKFYSCWLRCWKCPYCRKSRKSVRQVSKSITPLWKYYVWVAVPVSLTPEKAQVIFHHIYSAHVFCYNQTYVRNAISTLQKANYKVLCNELKESLYPEKTYIDKFLAYSLKKSDFQTVVDSVEVSSSTKTGEKEVSTKKRKTKKNAVSDIQLSEDELPPVVTRKKSVLKTLDDLPFPGEDSKKSQRKGHTPPAEPKRVKEVKSTVASKLTCLSTPPTRNIKSVRNLRTSPDEGKREASFLSSDISFHEDFFLTSTQVRPGNKQILDTSLGESPALLPALKERDTLREKEKSKLKLSKAKEKHRNVEEKQKDYEISSEDPDDCSNEERSDFNNHTEVSKLNSSSAEEYVTVNETTEEATNITSNSNVKNSTVLNRKSITSSLNTTYTLDSPMTSMASKSEGSVQVNHSHRNKKRSSTDVCSSNIVDKTHDKTAECSSPEPEDYLPCGQRPREDRSSGYKGGSSEGQNESSLANTGNDSVYFCYTALPTHINPAVLVLDSQAASEQNNCLVDETLTETNSNPLDGYEGKCIIQETQSQEILSQSVVDSTSQVTDFPNPNGCGLGAGKNYVKVECEDTGTQYSENSEPFSLTQGQQEPMPFSQNAQELVYSADVTDTTDFTTFCKTELTSPLSEKEYKIFEVQYEDIEQEATSPSTLEVFDSVKQESVTVGNPTSVVHGTTVEFSDIDNDKFASPKCAVEEIIHSNCLDTPTAAASNEETSDSEEVIGPSQELVVTSPPNFKSFNRSSRSCGSASGGSFVSNTSGESEQDQASLSIYSSLTALQDFSPTVAESEKIGRKDKEKDILEVLPLNSSKGSVQEEMEYASLTCKEKQGSSHGKGLNDLHPSLTQNQRGDVTVRNTSTISNITLVDNKEQEILDVLCERPVKSDHHSDESFVTADSVADRLSRESLQSVDTNDDSESQSSSTSKLRIDISNSNLLPGNSSAAETTDVRDRCDQNAKKNQKKDKTTGNSDVYATVDAHKNQGMGSVTNEVGNTDVDSFVTALDESQRGKQKKKYCALEVTEDVVSELFTNDVETFKSKKKKKEKKLEITILPTMQVNGIPNSDEVDGSAYETSKKSKKGKEKKRKEKTSDKVSEKTEQANLVSHSSKSKKKHKSDETETEEDCDKYWLDLCIDLPFPDLDKENEVLVSENSSSKSKSHKTKTKNDTSKASILKCSIIDSDELEIPDFDNLEPEESIREKINPRKSSRNKNKKEEKESNKSEDRVNKKKCLESKEEIKEVVHLDVSENQEKKKSRKKKLQEKLQVDVFDIEVDKKHKSTNNIGQKVDNGLSLPTKREKKKHKKEKDDFITCDLLPFPDIEIEGCSISKAENESVDGITSQKKKRKNEDIDIRSLNAKRKKKEYLETSTSKDIDEKCNGNTSIKATPEVSQVNGHYDCSDLDKRKKHKKNKSKATENESLPGLDVESVLDLINENDEYSKRDTEKKNKKRQRGDGTDENKEKDNPENAKKSEHNTPVENRSESLKKRSKRDKDSSLSKKEEQKESSSRNKAQEELRRKNNKKNCLTPPWNRPLRSSAKFHKLYNPENDDLL